MHDCKASLDPNRLQRLHRWMKTEKAIEIDNVLLLNRNRGAHRVVGTLSMRNDDVQSIGGTTLEDHNQSLVASAALGTKRSACQETRQRRSSHHRHRSTLHECPSCNRHFNS